MNKKYFYIICFLLLALSGRAQQDAQYSQYMFNGLVLNPAFAGSSGGSSFALFHRSQWVGFEDHPVSQSFSYNQPFYFDKGGFGIHIQNDKIGLERKTGIVSSWAYRFATKKATVSFGLQAGLHAYRIDQTRLKTHDVQDQTFYPTVAPTTLPDIGFGLYYKRKKWYVGFSIPHLLETQIDVNDYQSTLEMAKLYRHYFITGAYRYKVNNNWTIIPSVLTKIASKIASIAPVNVDATVHVMFRNKIWAGGTYRFGDSFNFQLGTKLNELSPKITEQIKIGYAFDLTTSNFGTYNNGSHEIMLMYDFGNVKSPTIRTPRFRY